MAITPTEARKSSSVDEMVKHFEKTLDAAAKEHFAQKSRDEVVHVSFAENLTGDVLSRLQKLYEEAGWVLTFQAAPDRITTVARLTPRS